jgi:hypothetical protein
MVARPPLSTLPRPGRFYSDGKVAAARGEIEAFDRDEFSKLRRMRSGRELVRNGRALRACPNTPLFEFTRETDYAVSASRQRGLAQRVRL